MFMSNTEEIHLGSEGELYTQIFWLYRPYIYSYFTTHPQLKTSKSLIFELLINLEEQEETFAGF